MLTNYILIRLNWLPKVIFTTESDFDFSYGLHSVFYYMPENLFGVGAVPEFAEKCPQVPKSTQNDIHAIQNRYFPS
jgi:hypothetical protein